MYNWIWRTHSSSLIRHTIWCCHVLTHNLRARQPTQSNQWIRFSWMRCQNQIVRAHTQQSSIWTETKFLPPKYTIGTVFNAFVDYLFPSRNLRVCIAFEHAEIHTQAHTHFGMATLRMKTEQSVWCGIRYEKRIANSNSLLISYYRGDALTPRPIVVTWDTSSRFGRPSMAVVRTVAARSFLRNEQEI